MHSMISEGKEINAAKRAHTSLEFKEYEDM